MIIVELIILMDIKISLENLIYLKEIILLINH